MSFSTLDPRTALIAVDVQQGIVGMAGPELAEPVVTQTSALATAFHAANLPVIWVIAHGLPTGRTDKPAPAGEPPAGFTTQDPRLPVAPTDLKVKKVGLSAFVAPETHAYLQDHNITGVVLTGIATGMGVESAARSAFDLGYNVTIATDAVADPLPERGQASLAYTLPGMAELADTAQIIDALTPAE